MKKLLIALVLLTGLNSKAESKNILSIGFGVADSVEESGTNSYLRPDGESGTIAWNTKKQDTVIFLMYQREVYENVFVGIQLGNNSSKLISAGFSF